MERAVAVGKACQKHLVFHPLDRLWQPVWDPDTR